MNQRRWVNYTTTVGNQPSSVNSPVPVNPLGPANALDPPNRPTLANSPSSQDSASDPSTSAGPSSLSNFPAPFVVITLVVIVVVIGIGAKCALSSYYSQAKDDIPKLYIDTEHYEPTPCYVFPQDVWIPSARELGTEYRVSTRRDEAPQDLYATTVCEVDTVSQQIPTEHREIGHVLQERQVSSPKIDLPDATESGKLPNPLTCHMECS